MDSTITTNINTILSGSWNYLFGANKPSSLSGTGNIIYYFAMNYIGASAAFLLSAAGAYEVGSTVITTIESDFWSFLDEFATDADGKFSSILDDEENNDAFHNFMTLYALDLVILIAAIFWHCFYLLGLGFTTATIIFSKTSGLTPTADPAGKTVNDSFRFLLFGLF